jgi:hypothetical protein
MSINTVANKALEQGQGIVRLSPTWVPRSFCIPGRRIKLHPDDYYAYGGERGGIDERWFSSTTPADNGPLTSRNEGLSHIVFEDGDVVEQFLLKDAIEELKSEIIGERIWEKYKSWPMYSKFFDNLKALPFHIHHNDHYAQMTGQYGKPEAYYFPPQVNNHGGDFPYTFFGFNPGTTKDQVRECLMNFSRGDNKITDLSSAQAIRVGTGWDVPPGVLHAPGSLCTYEPQKASDVFAIYESLTGDTIMPEELLWKNTPEDKIGDYDYLLEVIDWDLNLDPHFVMNRKMLPIPVFPEKQMEEEGFKEYWICYKSNDFSAKELTVMPGYQVTIKDNAAYGMIMMQGYGKMGVWDIETPAMIRFGQLTRDEYFISEKVAREGVVISNASKSEPLVMLKHFGPDNPDLDVNSI